MALNRAQEESRRIHFDRMNIFSTIVHENSWFSHGGFKFQRNLILSSITCNITDKTIFLLKQKGVKIVLGN